MKKIYSMNSDWKFKIIKENENTHMEDYFDMFSNNSKTGAAADMRGNSYYDEAWEDTELPNDLSLFEKASAENSASQGYKPPMKAYYRKNFTLDNSFENKKIFLKFDAIAVCSTIYINGIKLHSSSSAYTPITIDITDFIEINKQNSLCVYVSSTPNEGWWYEGCGIYGNTYLIACDRCHLIEYGTFVKTANIEKNKWKLELSSEISEHTPNTRLEYEINGLFKTEAEYKDGKYRSEIIIDNPDLWSPDFPNLYTLNVRLYNKDELSDTEDISVGFRTVTFDTEKGCCINSVPIKLKGVCLHHDHAGVGIAVPYDLHVFRLKKLKEMGCNAIRTSHNPQLKEFYKACDELGFLVMNEVRHFSSTSECLSQLETFIRRDRNHPCVIMWSMFNEEPLQCTKIGKNMVRSMKAVIEKHDGTRPVTGGMNGPFESEGVVECVDIMGFNYMQYGYDEFHKLYPNLPIMGSETGSYLSTRYTSETCMEDLKRCSFGNVLGENLCAWSATPEDTWKNIEERNFVIGGFYWTGIDYKGECGAFPSVVSSFGAMDICCFPKDNFFRHKSVWSEQPVLNAVPYYFDDCTRINCYSNCDRLEVYTDGKLFDSFENNKFAPRPVIVDKDCKSVEITGLTNGQKVISTAVEKHSKGTSLKLEPSCDCLTTAKDSLCIINICLTDDNNNVDLDADNIVKISVTGGAKLIGVGNGNNTCRDLDKSDTIPMFHGCCQAIVASDGSENNAEITITCQNTDSQTITLSKTQAVRLPEIHGEPCQISIMSWRASDVHDCYPEDKNIANLMFAWIPTTVGYGKSLMFSKKHGYGIIAGQFIAPTPVDGKKPVIVFEKILGSFDIYFNKTLVKKHIDCNNEIILDIPQELHGKNIILTIVFEINGEDCGIPGTVYVKTI